MNERQFWRALACALLYPAFRHGDAGDRVITFASTVLCVLTLWGWTALSRRISITWIPRSPTQGAEK